MVLALDAQPIFDVFGRVLGCYVREGRRIWVSSVNGWRLGYWDRARDETYRADGRFLGTGNLLASFLTYL